MEVSSSRLKVSCLVIYKGVFTKNLSRLPVFIHLSVYLSICLESEHVSEGER